MSAHIQFAVWRRQMNDKIVTEWFRTSHTIKARTTDEAHKKLRRMFSFAGFHSMSLLAAPMGVDPNKVQS